MASASITRDIKPLRSTLQDQIEELSSAPHDHTIHSLAVLLPQLVTSISATGDRVITHPEYEGTGNLDDLGRIYLKAADRCTTEHASFSIRLLHVTLDSMMEGLYVSSQTQLRNGLKDGTVNMPPSEAEECACCMGEPFAVILAGFHEKEALLFWEDEYRAIWGDEETQGGRYGAGKRWLRASMEQVERAMARETPLNGKL
ncbi:hypothetical protein P175DRAFT_0501097 [Aspergillus ochraceoroseus IBT 24754]|uniref:Uncharacterized protein n=2 Tax=Aspergillus ochraceoroseus TaxID=138278 RepID=A0A2T5LW20_9EURO|nr:uncharacterized protein P175DRAFT_0501097 [Aspergillus ochraceoroseus IBT 24754]KKK22191.1 hypothetical protein AOCH_001490 [Aspergillus ochraceoroseus]PTU20478.1 hypothetical protein P175DRAFT_0501097 [Aspergillus ochraceoroseus IBT 24754]